MKVLLLYFVRYIHGYMKSSSFIGASVLIGALKLRVHIPNNFKAKAT